MSRVRKSNKAITLKKKKAAVKIVDPMYGSDSRPPQVTMGTNIRIMRPPKNPIYSREVKLRIAVSTTGAQTTDSICVSIYQPQQYTRIVGGSITPTTTLSADLTNLAGVFREYRVKKILCQFTNSLGQSTAFPPLYSFMDPESTPTNVGAGATGVAYMNPYQNSVQVDSHVSSSWGYWIPPPSSIVNNIDVIAAKGWLSTDYLSTSFAASTPGIIGVAYGDSVLTAPLTTTAGVLDVIYLIQFRLAE